MTTLATLDDLDTAVLVLAQTRTCSSCRQPTMTATPRQSAHGRCLSCIHLAIAAELEIAADERAQQLCMDAFPGALVTFDWVPRMYAPDTYGGMEVVNVTGTWLVSKLRATVAVWVSVRDAGPCTRCQRTIRRYGSFGSATCTDCRGTP